MTFTEEEVMDMFKMMITSNAGLKKAESIMSDFKYGKSPTKLLNKVCYEFDISVEDIISPMRTTALLNARVTFFQECKRRFPYMHYKSIALYIGKDRSTMYRYDYLMTYDRSIIKMYNSVKDKV